MLSYCKRRWLEIEDWLRYHPRIRHSICHYKLWRSRAPHARPIVHLCAAARLADDDELERQIQERIVERVRQLDPRRLDWAALVPDFPKPWLAALGPKGFVFLNVDGGVINNNPFDYAQYALMGDSAAGKTGADDSDRAVIMVSPFPEPPAFLPDEQPAAELVAVIRALFPALINQSRFKTAELVPALDPNDHSRFLITPQRKINGIEQRYAIACGLLDGFGGFLDEKFRAHDFQLGRRNCQAFLRSTFGLSPNNNIVASLRDRNEFELPAAPVKYAIIPRLGNALPEVALPHWPRMSQADLTVLMHRIKGRLDKLAPRFVQAQTASRFFRALGRIGLRLGQGRVLEYVKLAILSDLVRRDQIEGWELPPIPGKSLDDVRLVLAELANPAFSFRTAEGIAKRTHLEPAFVTGVLAQLETVDDSRSFLVWQGKFEDREDTWLRWCDREGQMLLTGAERAEQERQRAEQERQRAEQERQRAEQEHQRAEQERVLRQQAQEQAERLAARLRELGIEPDQVI